jgi:putative transposase
MNRKRHSDEQIAGVRRQAESGATGEEICRKMDASEATFFRRKKRVAGMAWPRSVR